MRYAATLLILIIIKVVVHLKNNVHAFDRCIPVVVRSLICFFFLTPRKITYDKNINFSCSMKTLCSCQISPWVYNIINCIKMVHSLVSNVVLLYFYIINFDTGCLCLNMRSKCDRNFNFYYFYIFKLICRVVIVYVVI